MSTLTNIIDAVDELAIGMGEYIAEEVQPKLVPSDVGTIGQVLGKTGASSFGWVDPPEGTGGGGGTTPAAIVDTRKLAALHRDLNDLATVKLTFVGDSTTEQQGSLDFVPFNATGSGIFGALYPEKLSKIRTINRGSVGHMSGLFVTNAAADGASGSNSGGKQPSMALALADNPSGYVYCYGINELRGGLAPGSDAGALGNWPDWRVAYGQPGMVNAAKELQRFMKIFVDAVRAKGTKADAPIIFRMPNAFTTGATTLANGVTAQQAMNCIRLAYRGDPALGVPSPETFSTGVLVLDTMGTVYSQTAYTTAPNILDADGLHPSVTGYRGINYVLAHLFASPLSIAIQSSEQAEQLKYREQAIAHGQYPLDAATITKSGEFIPLYTGNGATASGFHDFQLNGISAAAIDSFWGGGDATSRGSARPPGAAIGDYMIYEDVGKTVRRIGVNGDANNGGLVIRIYSGTQQLDGTLRTVPAPSAAFSIWRHKYLHSNMARRNVEVAESGFQWERDNARKQAYMFEVSGATNGTLSIRAIGPNNANGLNAYSRTPQTTDVLCLVGVDGDSNGQDRALGLLLTGATFAKASGTLTITKAGIDFRTYNFPQGFILASDVVSGGGSTFIPGADVLAVAGGNTNLVTGHDNTYLRFTGAAAATLTAQTDATAPLQAKHETHIANRGTSTVTIVAASGVTVNAPAGGTLVLTAGMTATLKRVSASTFDLMGATT